MKKLLVLLIFVIAGKLTFAQADVVEFIKAGKVDASKLMKAYLDPYGLALGDGLNNGWYYTAKTHDRFGFDFSMSISSIRIPESGKTFDIGGISLQDVVLNDPTDHVAPTVAGAELQGPKINILAPDASSPSDTLGSFFSPPGIGTSNVPIPVAQLSIGLLSNTDVTLRYVPKLHFNQPNEKDEDVQVGLFGVGVKHNFKESIPGLRYLPFDAAIFASYSNITASTGIDFQLDDYMANKYYEKPDNYVLYDDQELDIESNTLKIGLIVSKEVAFITFFGGVGNSQSKTTVDLLGRYPVAVEVEDNKVTGIEDEVDPIKMKFESSRLSMDAGLRMKLGFFNVFASVNKAEYLSLNAGVSLSVR